MSDTSIRIKKILVATDFSVHSKIALARAIDIAVAFQCQLTAVHCVPDLAFVPSGSEFGLPNTDYMLMQEDFGRDASAAMKNYLEGSVPQALPVNSKILVGDPHIELSVFAETDKADLVIAGRSGHSGWEQFFLGSTSRGLVHRCPVSVLAVSDQWTQKPKSILAGTDFSDKSRDAVLYGLAIAEKLGGVVHLMHVIDTTDTPSTSVNRMTSHDSMRQSINDYAQSRLEAFVQTLECDASQLQLHLSWGTPWRDMCQTAEKINADLIVIGNVGRRSVQRVFVGNTADRILSHSKTTVLAVKSAGQ